MREVYLDARILPVRYGRESRIVGISVVLVVGLLIVLFTCGRGERYNFAGNWIGHRGLDLKTSDPTVGVTLNEVILMIKGGRFNLQDGGLDYSGPVAYDGGSAVLVPDEIEGRPVDRQPESVKKLIPTVELKPNADGSTLTETETITGREPVVLGRQRS